MSTAATQPAETIPSPEILPTLFGVGYGNYQVQRTSFVLSVLVHVLGMILLLTGGIYLAAHHNEIQQQVIAIFPADDSILLPKSTTCSGGGGGGGDRDKLATPRARPHVSPTSNLPLRPL